MHNIENVKKGDEIVLLGNQGNMSISVASFSDFSNQLNYELTGVVAQKPEDYSVSKLIFPNLMMGLEKFHLEGVNGYAKDWKEFGKWTYPFYEETNPFKPERVEFFKSLIKDATTEQEKIATLYSYMQKEFRYVSIQFGIGGFKPFPVSFAEQKKYGDCKGLTHYMKNMLQANGPERIILLLQVLSIIAKSKTTKNSGLA